MPLNYWEREEKFDATCQPSNILFSGTSEIDDALSGFPEQIQNIKREQILNCENNMGYLQSYELGEMIKDRCINGILGK